MYRFRFSPDSNAGGDGIIQTALEFWKAGKNREEIELKDLETTLSLSVFNNNKSKPRSRCGFFKQNKKKSKVLEVVFRFSSLRRLLSYKFDRQEPGGLLRSLPASGVPARGTVRHGRDGGQKAHTEPRRGGQGGQGFGLLPQIRASVLRQRLQDDREQTGLLHIDVRI